MGEQRIAGTYLAGNRAAKIAGEEHGAENRRAWNDVENGANQQHYADWNNYTRVKSQTNGTLDGRRKVQNLDAAIKKKKKHRARAVKTRPAQMPAPETEAVCVDDCIEVSSI